MSAPVQTGAVVNTQGFGNGPLNAYGIIPIRATYAPSATSIYSPSGGLYKVGQTWVNTTTNTIYQLSSITSLAGTVTATWVSTGSSTGTLSQLIPDAGTSPVVPSAGAITLAGTANQILTTGGTNSVTLSLIGPYTPATYTAHGVLVGEGASSIMATTPGTNGQVLLGSTGANPAFGTLTSTTGVTFTTGAGSLAINTTGGGLKANAESGAGPFVGATQNSYIFSEAAQTTVSLPATSAIGDLFICSGTNANTGGFLISQAAGQEIFSTTSNSTAGATGSISTAAKNTSVILMCTAANTTWQVLAATGTVTYT